MNQFRLSLIFASLLLFLFESDLFGQDEVKAVQFSGRVIEMNNGQINDLIYTNIAVKGTPRGTTSDIDGFFSLAVREGEVVQFSRIGYALKEVEVPIGLPGIVYSKDVIMNRDTLFLPEALISPWPDKDFFKIEFLALEVSNILEDIVKENLSTEKLQYLVSVLPADGREASKIQLQQTAASYYYFGQIKPQNIFNPLSWKKFIDAIKRGDYKKKDKK